MTNVVDLYYKTDTSLRDSIKTLRANIQFASLNKEIKTVVLTSVVPNEGKTTLSCFLGISMAETGKKTVVVECDYRHPMVSKNFCLSSDDEIDSKDLSKKVNANLKATKQDNLWILDVKTHVSNPVELISSESYKEMVQKLRDDFDFVIFDTPPLGAFIDAAHIAALADGTILVIKQGQVERRAAKDVLKQLEKANANVIGAVINNVKIKKVGYYYNYYHYYSNKYYNQRDDRSKHHRRHSKHRHTSSKSENA
jgi:capsular exopolysaccharide synthesis family protein